MTTHRTQSKTYAVCLGNNGYEASLVVRRIYELIPDAQSEQRGLLRVVDESGEDYLFPAELFARIELPDSVKQRFALAT